jgi:hypothetical protein
MTALTEFYRQVITGEKRIFLKESLDFRGTEITELPEDLHVGGYLNLRGTRITALPEDLHVKGTIYGLKENTIRCGRSSDPKRGFDLS